MAEKTWYEKRSDTYHIDPRTIIIQEGHNPRIEFDLGELKASIKESGILVPLRIRRTRDGQNILADGERRYRATMELIDEGVPILTVPCLLEKATSDAEILVNAMLANTGKPFTDMEFSEACRRFMAWGWNIDQLAKRLGKSAATVRNSLALLDAAPAVVQALQNGTVSRTEAVAVVREARRTDEDQGALLAERQEVKRERKSEKGTRGKLPETPEHWQAQAQHLCAIMGPVEMVNAAIEALRATAGSNAAYVQALLDAQDIAARTA